MRYGPGPEGKARAYFSAPPPTVVFCANRLRSKKEVEEAMVHELIHAYDVGPFDPSMFVVQRVSFLYLSRFFRSLQFARWTLPKPRCSRAGNLRAADCTHRRMHKYSTLLFPLAKFDRRVNRNVIERRKRCPKSCPTSSSFKTGRSSSRSDVFVNMPFDPPQ